MAIITIIGVKSTGQKLVGIIFFIFLYIGSKISLINFGLIFSQNKVNQDKITSNIIIYEIISRNIIIAKIIEVIIFLCYLISFQQLVLVPFFY
jgi:hypothetical protein